jgi:hypothetical protein
MTEGEMAVPPYIRKAVEAKLQAYCTNRIPAHLREKIRLGFIFRGNSVTLFEERPTFYDRSKWSSLVVAKFRFDPENGKWSLYWADRNSHWHLLSFQKPVKDFGILLRVVEENPHGCFWG